MLQLRVLYHRVKVAVAPLLSGAGVKGKVRCARAMPYDHDTQPALDAFLGLHLHNSNL